MGVDFARVQAERFLDSSLTIERNGVPIADLTDIPCAIERRQAGSRIDGEYTGINSMSIRVSIDYQGLIEVNDVAIESGRRLTITEVDEPSSYAVLHTMTGEPV
jgi:hypothetical protein